MAGIEFCELVSGSGIKTDSGDCIESASNQDRDKVEAYNMNVAGYILKPVTFSVLVGSN